MKKTALLAFCLLLLSLALSAQTYTSVKTGNWNDPTVWDQGSVPTSAGNVVIAAGQTITVNITGAQCADLTVSATGGLTVSAGDQLTMGPAGGGNMALLDDGILTIAGTLDLNGSFSIDNNAARLVMSTGGLFTIDGNDGTTGGSVANGTSLFTVTSNASYQHFNDGSTGGTILMTDPPQGSTSYAINCSSQFIYFNSNVTVQFGDGVSTTAGGNSKGFSLQYVVSFGSLVVDNPGGTNRIVTQNTYCGVMGNLNIIAGEYNSNSSQLYFAGNVTNNGTLDIFYLECSAQVGTSTAVTTAQTISGSGVFNDYQSSPDANMYYLEVNNSSAGGVTLNVNNLTVNTLSLDKGQLFLGSNNLTVTYQPGSPAAGAWVATNGTGALVYKNVGSSTSHLYPIGTATEYTPITISNSGTTDNISARVTGGVTDPNNSADIVNLQWILTEGTAGGSNLTLTAQWNGADEAAGFVRDFAYMGHYNGSGWDDITQTGATGGNPYTLTAGGFTNVSSFAIGSGNGLSSSGSTIVQSVKTGNWSDPTTWNAGRAPVATDVVDIAFGNTVTLDANGVAGSLSVSGTLQAGANTLTIGVPGTHNNAFLVSGTLNNTGATITDNGYMIDKTGGTLNMSAGTISIDGNDGNASTSVDATHALLYFEQNSNTSFTGGTITIVDPHLQSTGNTINGYMPNLGSGGTLQLGDGVSTQTSDNTGGFVLARVSGSPDLFAGNLVVNTLSGSLASRIVTNSYGTLHCNNNLTLTSGELTTNYDLQVAGNIVNNATLTLSGYLVLEKNNAAVTTPQTISGSGTFRNSASSPTYSFFGLQVDNTSSGGVTLQTPLNIQYLYIYSGELYLGNSDLHITTFGTGGDNAYVVTNGTGELWYSNLGSGNVTLYMGDGTNYNPIILKNTGTTDNIGVQYVSSVTSPNNSAKVVNAQWNLTEQTPGGSNLTATLQWNGSQEAANFNRAVAYVAGYGGSAWTKQSSSSVSGSNPYTITVSGMTTVEPIAIGSGSGLDASVSDAITSVKSGNWSDVTVWNTGAVPTVNDAVNISSGNTVTLDVDGSCSALTINGGLTDAAHTLNIGAAGTNNNALVVYGTLTNTGGTIDHNGYVLFKSGSVFSMSAGTLTIDGNNGNALSSVDASHSLLSFESSVTGSFTGGTLVITNPHLASTGNAIDGTPPAFGTGSTLQFGDGSSTQTSNNAKGFAVAASNAFVMGNVIVNTGSDVTRIVSMNSNYYIDGDLTISSSELRDAGNLAVGGNLINNGILTIPDQLALQLYSGYATSAQTIGGTGVFRNDPVTPTYSMGYLYVLNSSAGGVTLNVPLSTSGELEIGQGLLYPGNNNLSVGSVSGGSATSYVVTNGTGGLTIRGVAASNVVFPVGTAGGYDPVMLNNTGTADDFTVVLGTTVTDAVGISTSLNLQWTISEATPGGSNVAMTFQWNAVDEGSGFNRTQAQIAHYDGSNWQDFGGTVSGTGPYTISASGFTAFSPYTITSNPSPLPVKLLDFQGQESGQTVLLTWQTAMEQNNDHFEIERSGDGQVFTAVGTVAGHGTADVEHNYSFVDPSPLAGLNYYRLRQVDLDDQSVYSPVVLVSFSAQADGFRIYPNPVGASMLHLVLPAAVSGARMAVRIYDALGQSVYTAAYEHPGGTVDLPVGGLGRGSYWLEVIGTGTREVLLFMRE